MFDESVHTFLARAEGLGLAGARQIVEEHGGTISVAPAGGGGTAFTVRLPIV